MSPEFRVFTRLEDVPADFGPCALTIGNFDGVHAGHRQILRRVVEFARDHGWRAAAMTFDPHPTRVVAPDRAPKLMTRPPSARAIMHHEGIDQVLMLPFNARVALWSPEYFVRECWCKKLEARAVLVGQDFRFGHKHAGDTELLARLGAELGLRHRIGPARVHARRPRQQQPHPQLVEAGHVSRACRLLTRPFALEGEVVSGQGIGSKQTVPTLNLKPDAEVLPKRGVYITRTHDRDEAGCGNPSPT